jgi:hypothetical protein
MMKADNIVNLKRCCFLALALALFLAPSGASAAQEMEKNKKVKVGGMAPISESLMKLREQGKFIILVLFPNPMQCEGCDTIIAAINESAKKHPDIAFIMKGGQDLEGASDDDTIALKRALGFVTMGEAMTYFIDGNGIIQRMTFGRFNSPELEDRIADIRLAMGKKAEGQKSTKKLDFSKGDKK